MYYDKLFFNLNNLCTLSDTAGKDSLCRPRFYIIFEGLGGPEDRPALHTVQDYDNLKNIV
jgi:hypothetical protein